MKLDDTNLAIVKQLIDGRKPFNAIADDLSIAENTVRSRINKMIDDKILRISGLINPEMLDGYMLVLVGIKLNTMNGVRKGEEFSKLKGVVAVCAVTGRYDLILIVCLNETFDLQEFITTELDRVEGLMSAETFVVYKSFNLHVPHTL